MVFHFRRSSCARRVIDATRHVRPTRGPASAGSRAAPQPACRPRSRPGRRSPALCRGAVAENRHWSASASTSAKASDQPFVDVPHSDRPHSRAVEQQRARRSDHQLAHRGRVPATLVVFTDSSRWLDAPSRAAALTIVDLPTPDDPISATVLPGSSRGASASRPVPSRALTDADGHARRDRRHVRRAPGTSSHTSALLRTMTGSAPLDHASAR